MENEKTYIIEVEYDYFEEYAERKYEYEQHDGKTEEEAEILADEIMSEAKYDDVTLDDGLHETDADGENKLCWTVSDMEYRGLGMYAVFFYFTDEKKANAFRGYSLGRFRGVYNV